MRFFNCAKEPHGLVPIQALSVRARASQKNLAALTRAAGLVSMSPLQKVNVEKAGAPPTNVGAACEGLPLCCAIQAPDMRSSYL